MKTLMAWNGRTHLGDQGPVLFHLVVVVVTAGEELPHLPAERLGDSAAHQSRQLLGPHRQVGVPARTGEEG